MTESEFDKNARLRFDVGNDRVGLFGLLSSSQDGVIGWRVYAEECLGFSIECDVEETLSVISKSQHFSGELRE